VTTILITGMSGTGKSTVLGELAGRGYRVVDLDDDGWSAEVATPDGSGVEQLWREDRLAGLLASDTDAPHFIAGCASNQGKFYDRFRAVVLLSVPVTVLRERIATRDTNGFGKEPHELERILRDLKDVEPMLRSTSTMEIDGSQPVGQVADAVEALLEAPSGGSS
jgi:dephospho-CoA kinase